MAANRTGPQEQVAPPGPARTGPILGRATRTEFVVLTRSDELLEQVGIALDGAGEVRHAENEEDARQFADPRNAIVMLLDAREQVDPSLVVERLHSADGSTVIVVFAPADAAVDVARAIKGSAAFAVLPIPLEIEKTRAVLRGAGEEAMARRALISAPHELAAIDTHLETTPRIAERTLETPVDVARPTAASVEAWQSPEPAAMAVAGGGARRSRGIARVVVAALVVLSVVAAAAWFYLRDAADVRTNVVADAEPESASAPAQSDAGQPAAKRATEPKEELLDRARAAFHERRYTDPEGDNALHYYRSVLAQDPQDGEAREGLDRIGTVLDGRLESALAEKRLDAAALTVEQLRLVRPGDPALDSVAAQIAERRVRDALGRGDLDQAADLMSAADRAAVPAGRLQPLRDQLARLEAAQLADRAGREAAQAKGEEAARRLTEAKAPGSTQVRPAVANAAPGSAQPLAQPAQRTAEASASVRPDIPAEPAESDLSGADFKRTRYVAPVYPRQALTRGLSGEVRVRLTIDAKGRVADVEVLSAEPAGVFEQAAASAVRKWRFEPIVRNGRAIEASVATTISFQADDAAPR